VTFRMRLVRGAAAADIAGAALFGSVGSADASTSAPTIGAGYVVEATREAGIGTSAETPKILTTEAVQASDVVITMVCGDTGPVLPGKHYLDWTLNDPGGHGIEAVRPIRDEIRRRVTGLLADLDIPVAAA
jgi:arsenate reductase